MNLDSLDDHLIKNSQAAMLAAIEIYNKPSFQYRDQCMTILLLNAWELLLKAILAKHGESIYYSEETNHPTRTLSWKDAFSGAEAHFANIVASSPTRSNLELLGSYRDKATHFYNEDDMSLVVYSLAQTSIVNYRDVLQGSFGIELADQINLRLLPLGVRPPIDVISYLHGVSQIDKASVASQYVGELMSAAEELKVANEDTGRLLTVFNIKLESVKKIGDADVVVAVDDSSDSVRTINRFQDPNTSHPLRQKEVLARIGILHGKRFTGYAFQAVVRKHNIRGQRQYCWRSSEGDLTRYSNDIVPFIKQMRASEIEDAAKEYGEFIRSRHKNNEARL